MFLSRHNGFGQIVTHPIVAEFTDSDGRVFFVVGPVRRATYDISPPYDIVEKGSGEWRHESKDERRSAEPT